MMISGLPISAQLFSIDIDYRIQDYYANFETWTEEQQWDKIILEGQKILHDIQNVRSHDEARICSHLPSSYFFKGDFAQALIYAERCSRVAEKINSELFLKGLYLQSASFRGLAGKQKIEWLQEEGYKKAVDLCEDALKIYTEKKIQCKSLLAKIHFNLTAAHTDNPKGNKEKAIFHYSEANKNFVQAIKDRPNDKNNYRDLQRIAIRLGDLYLSRKEYLQCREVITNIRTEKLDRQLAIYVSHLEAKLEYALGNFTNGEAIANKVIEEARKLDATALIQRAEILIKEHNQSSSS